MHSKGGKSTATIDKELFDGLNALAESAFPKSCACCGRTYQTAEEFLHETEKIPAATSSMKSALEEDGTTIVEVFRNCPCGSTLMDEFGDRRDMSERGHKRRQHFNKMMSYLEQKGIANDVARKELLKVLRGEKSSVLATIPPPKA
ncbi:hypothetical protein [Alkalimarinus sediminis]|uniref:Uncharacterized protein n=1 Tax=Alkalimarinus sediminis TaxID=1632866 RepID=A0A9E8HK73_9ALTE|nr:hypothetical protein [Alkalimarinus sediminis]UZW75662.1 hypothetical protein NNL22_03440 [Alkalimarinus sediminis]